MIKKNMMVLVVMGLISFGWLNWVILPHYGSATLALTLPFYAAFIGAAWQLGCRMAEKRSGEAIRIAGEHAHFAWHRMNEVMQDAEKMRECYTRLYEDANRISKQNEEKSKEIAERQRVMAEEADILGDLVERHRPYEEMESRLRNCERERVCQRDKLKRIKKIMQLNKISDDDPEIN